MCMNVGLYFLHPLTQVAVTGEYKNHRKYKACLKELNKKIVELKFDDKELNLDNHLYSFYRLFNSQNIVIWRVYDPLFYV